MLLTTKAQQSKLLREQITALIQVEDYSIDTLTALNQQLANVLSSPIEPQDDVQHYAFFLEESLEWLKATMIKLSKDKNAIAENMLQIRKGRHAQHTYGQHN